MSDTAIRKQFSAEGHALLFAWMVKEIIDRVGESKAAPVIGEAVRRYGMQRGARMAMRARANGQSIDMLDYLAYGEWKAGRDEMKMTIIEKKTRMRVKIPRCPWHTAWRENDLMRYGRYYCLHIDRAVLQGFNPALRLEVNEIKPEGAQECDMVFHDISLTPPQMLRFMVRKLIKPGKSALMPWDYHTGHIYKTIGDTFIESFKEKGREAGDAALAKFSARYGGEAARVLEGFADCDFNKLP